METDTVEMTPTWEAVLPIYIAALQGKAKDKREIISELQRMARQADKFLAMQAKGGAL